MSVLLGNNAGVGDKGSNPVAHLRHKKLQRFGEAVAEFHMPAAPTTFKELGVDLSLVNALILKQLLMAGTQRSDELAKTLAIPLSLLEEPLTFLHTEALITSHSRDQKQISDVRHLSLTSNGRRRAHEHMQDNSYCGPLPVSYEAYRHQVSLQTVRNQFVDKFGMKKAFANVVINPEVLSQFGAAFNSGSSVFLYGPPGTGKTFIAKQAINLLSGDIAIPHAMIVDGQIIRIYDPVIHERVMESLDNNITSIIKSSSQDHYDNRWLRCHRPVIIASGELTLEMLDLRYQKDIGFYEAPLQMKANGGILMIDDLGRQVVAPTLLLNRWIMPLEYNVDYLALHTGTKFQVPFDVIPIFSTNMEPSELVDEAFLRRLGYKIHVDYVTPEEYAKIFQQYCDANSLAYNEAMVDYLISEHYRPSGINMAASHPKELINKVIDFSLYDGIEPAISEELLAKAWNAFFVI